MHRERKTICLAAAICLLLTLVSALCACNKAQRGDYPYYPDAASLVEESDLVIVGEVVSAGSIQNLKTTKDSDETETHTVAKVRVKQVLKGGVNVGDEISISQIGNYLIPQYPELKSEDYIKKGTEQLFFLVGFDNLPYCCVTEDQGRVEIRNGKLYSSRKLSLYGYKAHEELSTVINELAAKA